MCGIFVDLLGEIIFMKFKFFTLILAFTALVSTTVSAQSNNPLRSIDVTISGFTMAKLTITDFSTSGGTIMASGTISGTKSGTTTTTTKSFSNLPITITSATCDMLSLTAGTTAGSVSVTVSGQSMQMGSATISITPENGGNQLRANLCTISKLNTGNASSNALLASLRRLVRTLSR
jgi:hypothetical protein